MDCATLEEDWKKYCSEFGIEFLPRFGHGEYRKYEYQLHRSTDFYRMGCLGWMPPTTLAGIGGTHIWDDIKGNKYIEDLCAWAVHQYNEEMAENLKFVEVVKVRSLYVKRTIFFITLMAEDESGNQNSYEVEILDYRDLKFLSVFRPDLQDATASASGGRQELFHPRSSFEYIRNKRPHGGCTESASVECIRACPPTTENIYQGYPTETLMRFLKARDGNFSKAHKMLLNCLNWRIQNETDNILAKPIVPTDFYRIVRDSQLLGMSGYSKEIHYYVQSHIQMNEYRDCMIMPSAMKKFGRHISTCVKILDMTGLKLSALNQIKLLTVISTIDDLNYPEKTDTYYIVNAPYIFSASWKVVKPLLQERMRKKVQVLAGCGRDEFFGKYGRDELLQIMDYSSLPHFCKREGSGSS